MIVLYTKLCNKWSFQYKPVPYVESIDHKMTLKEWTRIKQTNYANLSIAEKVFSDPIFFLKRFNSDQSVVLFIWSFFFTVKITDIFA